MNDVQHDRSGVAWLAAALVAGCLLGVLFATPRAVEDAATEFKYGSIGTEVNVGVPYWVFRVLPEVFADKLPDRAGAGYARIGFVYETPTSDLPIGTTKTSDFVPLVGLNCATCHVGRVRETTSSPPRVVLGMPAQQMDLQAYVRFLTACGRDPRFNADTLIAAMKKHPEFGVVDSLVYRFLVIGRTKKGILERAGQTAWFDKRPPQGPGRVDTFNPYKAMFPAETHFATDESVGTADLPSLWNQRIRQGLWLHWDGNNNSVEERNKSAAIGAGATPESLNEEALNRIGRWILDLKPPPFPRERIDAALAEAGKPVYAQHCASCHEIGQPRVGQVTEIGDVGTDPERLRSFTPELATQMNKIGEGKPWRFSHFRKTNGYAGMPLDGIWLRAPYLHNGSVPTLRALLFLDERPAVFYRGFDVYDWRGVGFVTSGPDAERGGARFDTALRGNGNGGHIYGRELSIHDREAIVEYLKTF